MEKINKINEKVYFKDWTPYAFKPLKVWANATGETGFTS